MKRVNLPLSLHQLCATLVLASATLAAHAQSAEQGDAKEESNRNVMLNAASANGPREIQIGLPSSDVNVLENGLPVTYATNPHSVNTLWRGDASLSHVGLLKIAETAITTGNIGYAVNSFTQLGKPQFGGLLNYKTNHFGLHELSLNLHGRVARDLYYSASVYQDFDPGTFKLRSTPYQDRTQIYKFALTKHYAQGRGELTSLYHFSDSRPVYTYGTQSAPFIYKGDGSIQELGQFALGTTSYLPIDANISYRDMRTGVLHETSFYDAIRNKGNNFVLLNNYSWGDGWQAKTALRYAHSRGALVYQTPMSLSRTTDTGIAYAVRQADGSLRDYTGAYVQSRLACLNSGTIDELLFTQEVAKRTANSTLRFGLNQWYYSIDYTSNTTMYDQSVNLDGGYPMRLLNRDFATNTQRSYNGDGYFYDYNKNASEYYKGHENKLALYFTHDWEATRKLSLYYGARLEYQRLKGHNAAVRNAAGAFVGRFANYHLGTTAPDGTPIVPTAMSHHWLNYALTAAATYKLNDRLGLTGDFSYITQHPRLENFSPATYPNTGRISVPLGRIGVYYNNDWLSVTSLLSYISKTNNNTTLNLQHRHAVTGANEILAAPLTYDIQTWGWTTDIVAKPAKGFDLHLLFTYQKPTYKKYETSVTFSDGYVGEINATGNLVAEVPQIIIEIDPSYMLTKDVKLWTSFRYFGKTYANINEAYYFNGRWETFGGVNWQVNKQLALGCTVVNFLNQTGAKGSIAGAELVTKAQADQYAGAVLAGSYIRPFTIELSAQLRF